MKTVKPLTPVVRPFTISSVRLADAWVPEQFFHRQILEQILVPTLRAYAQYLLGERGEPSAIWLYEPTLDRLRRWLVEDSQHQYWSGQVVTPAMVAYAFHYGLEPAEATAIEHYCQTGARYVQQTLTA